MKTNYPFSKGNNVKTTNEKKGIQKQHLTNKRKNNMKQENRPKKSSSIPNLITKKHRYPITQQDNKNQKKSYTEHNDNFVSMDILNFSKIDDSLNKLKESNSYSDIFETKFSNDRYKDIDTPLNTSMMENKKNDMLTQTPSTICNYYDDSKQSTAKKKFIDNKGEKTKANLNKIYDKMRNEATEPKQNKLIKVNRNKNLYTGKKHTSSSIINTNNNTNLLLKNYLNGKINKNGSLSNIKKVNKCKTASVDFQKNLSINKNIVAKHNTINNYDNNTTAKKNTNQLRPVMLYLDQMKYESYFITPNSKRVRKTISSIKNKNISAKSTLPSSFSSGKLHNGISKNSSGINYLKVSKTLTEQNILNMVQNTPKTNKISFISSQSAITKKNLYRNSSSHMTMIKVGKAKTQSALKNKNCEVVYNTNEKDVKQKLLDRMNKAIKGNWNYLYKHKGDDKKKLMENISAIIQTPNKDKNDIQSLNKIVGHKLTYEDDCDS